MWRVHMNSVHRGRFTEMSNGQTVSDHTRRAQYKHKLHAHAVSALPLISELLSIVMPPEVH